MISEESLAMRRKFYSFSRTFTQQVLEYLALDLHDKTVISAH
jgi:hypothetical protein